MTTVTMSCPESARTLPASQAGTSPTRLAAEDDAPMLPIIELMPLSSALAIVAGSM